MTGIDIFLPGKPRPLGREASLPLFGRIRSVGLGQRSLTVILFIHRRDGDNRLGFGHSGYASDAVLHKLSDDFGI